MVQTMLHLQPYRPCMGSMRVSHSRRAKYVVFVLFALVELLGPLGFPSSSTLQSFAFPPRPSLGGDNRVAESTSLEKRADQEGSGRPPHDLRRGGVLSRVSGLANAPTIYLHKAKYLKSIAGWFIYIRICRETPTVVKSGRGQQ